MKFFNIVGDQKRSGQSVANGVDPRTKEKLWDVPVAQEKDLNDAVTIAQEAFKTWRVVSLEERQGYLNKLADEIEKKKDELVSILSKETGKSDLFTSLEIDVTAKYLRYFATQSVPDTVEFEDEKVKIVSTVHPIGIVGAICPWNFPLTISAVKIGSSLLLGNCVIVKPSPFTPYTTIKLAEIALSILPAGVFQALNGGNDIGRLMTVHPGIHKISFTGSIATGKKVAENAASTLKRVTLELGGNDASIVCADVDVSAVAQKVAKGCFNHAGQVCVATKRVYVHKDIYDEFYTAFLEATKVTVVYASAKEPSLFSPLQNQMQYDIVKSFIADSKAKGYTIASGGSVDDQPGFFLSPTVIDRPPENSDIVQREQFGPIIPLLEWSNEDDVISRANLTNSGLGACVWSKDVDHALNIARRLESGSVWVNSGEFMHPAAFVSGWKESGLGGEAGRQGLMSYCQTQSLFVTKS